MTEIILQGDIFSRLGCTDPLASNYDPNATQPCQNCCQYGQQVIGCTDTLATNYKSDANISCKNCCIYTNNINPTSPNLDLKLNNIPIIGFLPKKNNVCVGPYTITSDNKILGVESLDCCKSSNKRLGPPPEGYQYYWDGKTCKIIPKCSTNTICIDCTNLNRWNDTYMVNHDNQSLSLTAPILWQQITNLIINSGQTISVNGLTGDLISKDCCTGVFTNGICFCQTSVEEVYKPKIIVSLKDFLNLIEEPIGYDFFINNFSTIGPSLNLTTEEINFIKLNINSTDDFNNDGILNLTDARLLITNGLNLKGGFYVNFGTITNKPILVDKAVCDKNNGYWDGNNCMGKPVNDSCEISLSDVKVITTYDNFNNPVRTVQLRSNGTPLNENCCNRLIKDNPNLNWVWRSPNCLVPSTKTIQAKIGEPRVVDEPTCVPATFNIGSPIQVDTCDNLRLSFSFYFKQPDNPCQTIVGRTIDDSIIIEGQNCDITLTPNTQVIEVTPNSSNISVAKNILLNQKQIESASDTNVNNILLSTKYDSPPSPPSPLIPNPCGAGLVSPVDPNGNGTTGIISGSYSIDYWDQQLYASVHNGVPYSQANPNTYQSLLTIINNGQGFYYTTDPNAPDLYSPDLTQQCCTQAGGTLVNKFCIVNVPPPDSGGTGGGTGGGGTGGGTGGGGTGGGGTGGGGTTTPPEKCCYSPVVPITAKIITTNTTLNQSLVQVQTYNSVTNGFDTWVTLEAILPITTALSFGLKLEISTGINCCCEYNIFVDNIKVTCTREVPELIYNNVQCPGFNLNKVIDNKKSWVYNPGVPSVGISEYDRIEREDGNVGMLNGEGTINRTFAPSLDANIPWRYTDYWQQSSVYEKHSKLVLNSKELWLTFDMCAKCPVSTGTTLTCPDGFTLSANTQICYKQEDQKLFQNGDNFIFMDGDNYIFQFQ